VTASPPAAAPEQVGGGPSPAELPSGDDNAAAVPQGHAMTIQDGSVAWQIERERTGSLPARVR